MRSETWKKVTIHLILLIGVAVSVFPFYWLFVMSTNTTSAVFAFPPKLVPGNQFWTNVRSVWEAVDFTQAFLNTVFVAVVITFFRLFFESLAGFTFAKYKFPGSKVLFFLLLATMMIPGQLSLVPQFMIMKTLGWLGDFKALIVPSLANAFGIFWIRQFAQDAIHDDLMDAGRIDGCNNFRLYFNVALPILRPGLAFLGITAFMGVWEDYMWPLVVLTDSSKFTLMVTLAQMKTSHTANYAMIMTGTLLATLPLIVFFLFVSRQFIAGLADGAVKS
ncbi:ABC transporter permease subunit [Cohnella sp. CFH 77786]|uniref:carbohydrate ABC transporter permease n=1 Tax=Cohnella sp. CFH 77786 TaxID=2662265 RepID=UPI001C60E6A9|nr:carbohydrate ABC transporter permease [Cohnella sp. CFH 77786]MBW5447554.1 ABC transporter permease subunit [Cohnella sp. CFH 77786]